MNEETQLQVEEKREATNGASQPQAPDSVPVAEGQRENLAGFPRRKKLLLGCGAAFISLICVMVLCAGVSYFLFTTLDSATLGAEADYPDSVRVGERFQLTLYLENKGEEELRVEYIHLADAFGSDFSSILEGASMIRTDPKMASFEMTLVGRQQTYEYGQVVHPGETEAIVFDLRAVEAGEFHTDIFIDLGTALTDLPDQVISITP